MAFEEPAFLVKAVCEEERVPLLSDISAFLFDFNLLYEFSRLTVDPKYKTFQFRPGIYIYTRKARRLKKEDQLRTKRILLASPLEFETLLAAVPVAAATIWMMVQVFERVLNIRLNRRLLREQLEKVQRENAVARAEERTLLLPEVDLEIDRRGAGWVFESLKRRFEQSSIRIREFVVSLVDRNLPK